MPHHLLSPPPDAPGAVPAAGRRGHGRPRLAPPGRGKPEIDKCPGT